MASRANSSILELFSEHRRVVGALMIREIYTRFGRENIGFLWLVMEPAMFCLGVVAIWMIGNHTGHDEVGIAPFVVTGYMPLLLFRHFGSRLMRCMQANGSLLYHRQVTVLSLYVSRLVVEFLSATSAFAFIMLAFYVFGLVDVPFDVPLMLGGWLLYAWFSASLALIIGAAAEQSEVVEKFWGPVSYLMIPFSGTFYMVYWMPPQVRDALTWSPFVTGVEMIRAGYFGPSLPAYYFPTYVVAISAVNTFIGLLLLSKARQHIEVE
jgi:capsular polysaccharide transport system permease protein